MEKVSIEKCEEKEVISLKKKYKLKLCWAGDRCFKVKMDGVVVALLEAELSEDESIIDIDNFEVFEKKNKVGSEIVEELKNTDFDMCLYVNSKGSRRFWERHGFKAQDDGTGVAKHYYFKSAADNFINENINSTSVK